VTASRPRAGRPLIAFLIFAAGLLVVSPVEASRTTTDARPGLSVTSSDALASPSLELSLLELVEPIESSEPSSRFGFGEDLGLLDPEAGPGGFVVFAREPSRCELTYARNNPLKYIDPDGKAAAAPGAFAAMVARRAFLGAALGAGVRLTINRGIQLSGHPEYKIWTGVQGAALTGAITGGANARTMAAKFVSNIAGVVAGNVWEGKKAGHSFEQLKTDALNGLAVGALSGGLDNALSARVATGVASAPAVVSEHVDSVVGAIVSTATSASQEAGTGILGLFDEIRSAFPGRKPEKKPEERPEKKAPTE
jgi:hypothetical protein